LHAGVDDVGGGHVMGSVGRPGVDYPVKEGVGSEHCTPW
jgi:hypothetical protein